MSAAGLGDQMLVTGYVDRISWFAQSAGSRLMDLHHDLALSGQLQA